MTLSYIFLYVDGLVVQDCPLLSLAKSSVFSGDCSFGRRGENCSSYFMVPFFSCFIHFPLFLFSPSPPRFLKVLLFYPFQSQKHSFLRLPAWVLHTFKSLPWSQCADLLGLSFSIFRPRINFLLLRVILGSSYVFCSPHSSSQFV